MDRYLRSFKIGFFGYTLRFRRAPRVHVLTVDFEDVVVEAEALVARLPKNLQWREYRIDLRGDLVHKRSEERRYSGYRVADPRTIDADDAL